MNDFERAICARVKHFRELIKWSQPDFAKEIGISRDQLANIEYARSPLRYALGVTLCQVFDISGHWLVTGEGQMRGGHPALWVVEFEPQHYFNCTFSEVYFRNPGVFKPEEKAGSELISEPTPGFDPEAWLMRSVYHWFHYNKFPDALHSELFAKGVANAAENILEEFRRAGSAIMPKWSAKSFPFIPQNPLQKIPAGIETSAESEIKRLHITSEVRKVSGVPTEIKKLLTDVRSLVSQKGMKAKLAAHLEVPQSRLSEWLAGKYEPSGEIALRLRNWVHDPKRQK
jgi:transcriptional regulator with XRE-family HTH domain